MSSPRPAPPTLGSSPTFDFAFAKLLDAQKQTAHHTNVTIIEPIQGETVFGARFTANDKYITLLNPACDKFELNHKNDIGTTPLAISLQKIRLLQVQNPDDIYIIPLSETQPILFGYTRDHWVVLMIQGDQCDFYDPCADSFLSLQASSVYPLATMKDILNTNGFTITNTIFLGWQKDTVNCGRYCGAIIGEIANMIFELVHFSSISSNLQRTEPKTADELVTEASLSIANKLIFGNKLICDFRRQEFIPDTLTRADLRSSTYPADSQKTTLSEMIAKKFIEKGKKDNLSQFILDFDRLKFKLLGKTFSELGGHDMTAVSIANCLKISVNAVSNIISAHSQGPFAFILFTLSQGIKHDDPATFQLSQVIEAADYDFNITRPDRKAVKLILEYKRLPIKFIDSGSIIGFLYGPVTVTYRLKQIKNDEWGWELDGIVTTNSDIKRILKGAILPHQYIFANYCHYPDRKLMPASLAVNNSHFVTPETEESIGATVAMVATSEEKLDPIATVQSVQLVQKSLEETATITLLNLKEQQLVSAQQANAELYIKMLAEEKRAGSLELEITALQQMTQSLLSTNSELKTQQQETFSQSVSKDKTVAQLRDANTQLSNSNAQLSIQLLAAQQQQANLQKQHEEDVALQEKQANSITLHTKEITQLSETNSQIINKIKLQSQKLASLRLRQPQSILAKQPLQPVLYYVVGTILTAGLTITGSLITLGILNLSLLATIPIAGWALATGICLAMASLFLVKSIVNARANAELAKAAVQEQKDPPSPSIDADLTELQSSNGQAVAFSPRSSSRERHGFHAAGNSNCIATTTVSQSVPTQSPQPR